MNSYTTTLINAIDTEKKFQPPQGWTMNVNYAIKIQIIRDADAKLDQTSDVVNYWAS